MKRNDEDTLNLAKKVQIASIQAAREGFREASIRGLCKEGAIEAAISAIQLLSLEKIIEESGQE